MAYVNGDAAVNDQWKQVQQKTFTRWCNEHLKKNDLTCEDVGTDFSDGTKLIILLELLSEKKIGKYNKNPKVRAHKMENVQQSLDFISREKIRLVNIRSYEIVDGNVKLILGMVWTLIQHYQISMGFKDQGKSTKTPKQALLAWLQDKLKDNPVGQPNNLTSDWRDGRRLAALNDAIAPGLSPNAEALNPNEAIVNVKEAMDLAEEYLDVPKLMNPEDIANPNMDELSMMTYLSEYLDATLQKPIPTADAVTAYGPGLESGIIVSEPTQFTIDISKCENKKRTPHIKVCGSKRNLLAAPVVQLPNGNFQCKYNPENEGEHVINITYGLPVKGSPFQVMVIKGKGSVSFDDLRVYGPAFENKEVNAGVPTTFFIYKGELDGDVRVAIRAPDNTALEGNEIVSTKVDNKTTQIEFVPINPGKYNVNVSVNDTSDPRNPYQIEAVQPEPDASKVKVTGDGVKRGIVGKPLEFFIDTRGAGFGNIELSLEGPSKCDADCEDHGNGTCSVNYTPSEYGDYQVGLRFAGDDVPGSPFTVKVCDPSKVKATGPGITGIGAKPQIPALVYLDITDAGEGDFSVKVQGPPGKENFNFNPNLRDNQLNGEYTPRQAGEYEVDIDMEGYAIPGSPFKLIITDPSKVKLEGPALKHAFVKKPTYVNVISSDTRPTTISAKLIDPNKKNVAISVNKPKDSQTTTLDFTPLVGGPHKLQVTVGGNVIEHDINVLDLDKVKAYGPGLEASGNIANKETNFVIETGGLDKDDIDVEVKDKTTGESILVKFTDVDNNKYRAIYTPTKPHTYVVEVTLSRFNIENSPYEVSISDPNLVKASGPGLKSAIENEETEFTIDASNAGDGSLGITIDGPEQTDVNCTAIGDNIYKLKYTPTKAGKYDVNINFSDYPIPGSPFKVQVTRGNPDASKCQVNGIHQPGAFTVDAMNAGGNGLLEIGVTGACTPCDFITVKHNGDYTFNVSYDIPEAGETTIVIKWHGEHIPGSPFVIHTDENDML